MTKGAMTAPNGHRGGIHEIFTKPRARPSRNKIGEGRVTDHAEAVDNVSAIIFERIVKREVDRVQA